MKFSIEWCIIVAVVILIMTEKVFAKIEIGQCLYRKLQNIMTFFTITRQIFGESFSSSNSTEILMRQFCVEQFHYNRIILRRVIVLIAGRPDAPADFIVYSRFEHTKNENIVISMLFSVFRFLQISLRYEVEKIEIGISNKDNNEATSKYIVLSTPY